MKSLSLLYLFGAIEEENLEYSNLTDKEKEDLDYMDKCLFSEDEKIRDASFKTMLLLLEIIIEPDKYEPEELNKKQSEIIKDLSNDEIIIINKYILACINSIGLYSKERIKERKLKKERK